MRRRRFLQAIAVAPAVPVVGQEVAGQQAVQQGESGEQPESPLAVASPEAAGDPVLKFFTPAQFAALQKLGDLLMPAIDGMPSASECQAAEFLDFLCSESPGERQQTYRAGLDALASVARKKYNKTFSSLDATQASELLTSLHEPWTYEPPADPLARFLRAAKADFRTATTNSRPYITAGNQPGRRGGGGTGQFWLPIY